MPGFLNSLFDPSVLYDTLKERNLLPDWAQELPNDGASGEYYPAVNKLVSNYPDNHLRRNTTAHEMTHAVQGQLLRAMASDIAEKQWEKKPLTPLEERYLKAAQTLFANQFGRVGQFNMRQYEADNMSLDSIINGLYKRTGDKRYDEYRTRPTEAQAFGVGNMSMDEPTPASRAGGAHFDPTMATDFSVLLDLYKRLPTEMKDASADKSRAMNDYNRKLPNQPDYKFKPADYPNPFLKRK